MCENKEKNRKNNEDSYKFQDLTSKRKTKPKGSSVAIKSIELLLVKFIFSSSGFMFSLHIISFELRIHKCVRCSNVFAISLHFGNMFIVLF